MIGCRHVTEGTVA